jgi:hypothetical protein
MIVHKFLVTPMQNIVSGLEAGMEEDELMSTETGSRTMQSLAGAEGIFRSIGYFPFYSWKPGTSFWSLELVQIKTTG